MTKPISDLDPYTVRHLDAWLDRNVDGDTHREQVRAHMLQLVAEDEEYYGSQGWWNVYDRAKCGDISRY